MAVSKSPEAAGTRAKHISTTSSPQHSSNDQDSPSEPEQPQADTDTTVAATLAPPLPDEPPPLPDEPPLPDGPPLPSEPPPNNNDDDGWDPVWDATAQAFYFYNRITQQTQWENPRIPQASGGPPGIGAHERSSGAPQQAQTTTTERRTARSAGGGYNPAIHGDYDPTADYAQVEDASEDDEYAGSAAFAAAAVQAGGGGLYETTGAFNRFTGKWQAADINPENHSDESKAKRQMSAFFDVDAAANNHDGKSLRAERQNKRFSKKEIKAFKEKRRDRKEEKRRAWLRD